MVITLGTGQALRPDTEYCRARPGPGAGPARRPAFEVAGAGPVPHPRAAHQATGGRSAVPASAVQAYVSDASWPRVRVAHLPGVPARPARTGTPGRSATAHDAAGPGSRHELDRPAGVHPTGCARAVGARVVQALAYFGVIVAWSFMATGGAGRAGCITAVFAPPIVLLAGAFRGTTDPTRTAPAATGNERSVSSILAASVGYTQPSVAASTVYIRRTARALGSQACATATGSAAVPCGRQPVSFLVAPEVAAACSLHLSKVPSLEEPWVILRGGSIVPTMPGKDRS
jgi:hypothetical protein